MWPGPGRLSRLVTTSTGNRPRVRLTALLRLGVAPLFLAGVAIPLPAKGQNPVAAGGVLYSGLVYKYPGGFVVNVGDSVPTLPLADRRYPPVDGVVPCSPAHWAGIEPTDVILSVGDRDAREPPLFPVDSDPTTTYDLRIRRGETVLSTELRLTALPDSVPTAVFETPMGPVNDWDCPSAADRTQERRRSHLPR